MRRYVAGLLVALALPAGHAAAQGPIAADLPVKLNQEDAARYFPDRAQRLGISSWARARCVPNDKGVLTGCVVVGEGRPDLSFGDALLKITRIMRVPAEAREQVAGKPAYVFHAFQLPKRTGYGAEVREPEVDPIHAPDRAVIEAARPSGAEPIGMATVTCLVDLVALDRFYDCAAKAEFPADQGYAAAAVALAGAYRVEGETPKVVVVRLSTSSASATSPQSRWSASVIPTYAGLDLIPTWGVQETDLPAANMGFDCQWRPDGQLRKCRADKSRMQQVPRKTARIVTGLLPKVRLVRRVMFNINWGQ